MLAAGPCVWSLTYLVIPREARSELEMNSRQLKLLAT
jgi:hypothetical protein